MGLAWLGDALEAGGRWRRRRLAFDQAPESLGERLAVWLQFESHDTALQCFFAAHVVHPVDRAHIDIAHIAALQYFERHGGAGDTQCP